MSATTTTCPHRNIRSPATRITLHSADFLFWALSLCIIKRLAAVFVCLDKPHVTAQLTLAANHSRASFSCSGTSVEISEEVAAGVSDKCELGKGGAIVETRANRSAPLPSLSRVCIMETSTSSAPPPRLSGPALGEAWRGWREVSTTLAPLRRYALPRRLPPRLGRRHVRSPRFPCNTKYIRPP